MALLKNGVAQTASQKPASRLTLIQHGIQPSPPRGIIYGQEKIGKSTIPCCAPNPIFIPTEDRVKLLNVSKFPVAQTFEDVVANLQTLVNEDHDHKTVVIDSLDWLETLIHAYVCRKENVQTIEKVGGGYGKGYTQALGPLHTVIDLLSKLWVEKNMVFVGICHSQIETFDDPTSMSYKRYLPQLHKRSLAVWAQWVDFILFATFKTIVKTETSGFNKIRGVATNMAGKDGVIRILKTVQSPAALAGNAYQFAPELPMGTAESPTGWASIEQGIGDYYAAQNGQPQGAPEPLIITEESPREPGEDGPEHDPVLEKF